MNIEKIKHFIHLTEKGRTGCAKIAAERIGVSERMIYNYVNILKNDLNAPIDYNRHKQTFFSEKRVGWFGNGDVKSDNDKKINNL